MRYAVAWTPRYLAPARLVADDAAVWSFPPSERWDRLGPVGRWLWGMATGLAGVGLVAAVTLAINAVLRAGASEVAFLIPVVAAAFF